MPQRSSLEELRCALRIAEPNTKSLSRYLEETSEHVAVLLGVEREALEQLVGKPDREVGPQLEALLHRRAEAQEARRAERAAQIAGSAAEHLARTAVWHEGRAHLDPSILFGAILADVGHKFIAFHGGRAFEVRMLRHTLWNAGEALSGHDDLAAWVDAEGLHFRWKNGRGGLNFLSQHVLSSDSNF
ncbi:hypothetical protein [Polyangium sp. 6x1]|uniref:hypothetical protein n=1 Tax=Polyangium sp. 6x1 TaxID=3042689 RepID=UPI002482185A|nr:hypothetical protein [Polyangium sp. 6x1]MDI1450835.1 hypothetical protein [Polyangium sp. 6x1]